MATPLLELSSTLVIEIAVDIFNQNCPAVLYLSISLQNLLCKLARRYFSAGALEKLNV